MKSKKTLILIAVILFGILLVKQTSATPFIVGYVNNSHDAESANGKTIMLWNPAIGQEDNLTDIIGITGNSSADNFYLMDCALLSNGCSVGTEIKVKVINTGDDYVTPTTQTTITGLGAEFMQDLRLNSKPTTTQNSPTNYANLTTSVNLTCDSTDLDGNLANVTLLGNWTGSWHANQTIQATGSTNSTLFQKNIEEGRHSWACQATDNLTITGQTTINYTITIDNTPPTINDVAPNITSPQCGTTNIARINCTTTDALSGVQNVTVQAFNPNGTSQNYTTTQSVGNTYYADVQLQTTGAWEFECIATDYSGNSQNKTMQENITVHSQNSDLEITTENIIFETLNPIENQEIIINATITNNGCSEANNFLVGYYNGDPAISSAQIGQNQTINVNPLSLNTSQISWPAQIGNNNIFVQVDIENTISEFNETNNKANKTLNVTAWQEFYGNVTLDKILANSNISNFTLWANESKLTGNIFITDQESQVSWTKLLPIGKNKTNATTTNDFTEIDNIFSMTDYTDSVANIYTTDGNTPKETKTFFIYQSYLAGVPVINSITTTNFKTGILWDSQDDDNDGEFSQDDKEDLVFVSEINKSAEGTYGNYDYEIRIPARLREYEGPDNDQVYIYFDLN